MGQELFRMEGISKSFPGVKALDHVSLSVNKGEVLGLVGENGAGKSTLMKILSGVYRADEGEIFIEGEKVIIDSVAKAHELGVSIIMQELNMCGHLSVADNIFIGRAPKKGMFIDDKRMHREAKAILDDLGIDLDTYAMVGSLSIAKQQMVEIAKAISLNSRVLIMDEPTSALTEGETKKLFQVISNLKKKGITMVYISHRMEEIFEICDSYSVMRDGAYIAGGMIRDVTVDKLIEYMVGRSLSQVFPGKHNVIGDIVLEARDISSGTEVRNVSFYLKQGEILGFAGLVGAGRTETLKAVFGADPKSKGQIMINGRTVPIHSPGDAIHRGIGFVPEDRKREGLVTELSVMDNVVMAKMDNSMNHGLFSIGKAKALCRYYIDSLMIKTPSEKQLAKYLSGGTSKRWSWPNG